MKANQVRADCSSSVSTEIRTRTQGKRVYFLVENRSFFTIFIQFDGAPASNGAEGIELLGQMKYELWGVFAPTNDAIYLTGTQPTMQQVNYTEGYDTDMTPYEERDHS